MAIIDQGRIIANGSPAELNRDGMSLIVENWNDQAVEALDGYHHNYTDGQLRIYTDPPELHITRVINRLLH